MLCIIKAVLAFIVLVVIGQTLVGTVLRGFFWSPPQVEASTERVQELLTAQSRPNNVITLFYFFLTVAFFYALYHFGNIAFAGSAGLFLVSRLPDVLWKIRAGKKIRVQAAEMPKDPIYILANIVTFLCLPLIWYSLCKW